MHITLPNGKLKTLQSFSELSISTQELLINNGKLLQFKRQQTIFKQNDTISHFYLVLNGLVKLTRQSHSQQNHLLDLISNGESIGLALMHQPKTALYPITAQCLIETEVLELSRDFYCGAWKNNSELFTYGSEQIQKRLLKFQDDICMQSRPLPERLAHLLTEKIQPLKNINMTRRDLAECIGSSTESVIRQFSLWSNEGLISTENRHIVIHDLEKIKKIWKK